MTSPNGRPNLHAGTCPMTSCERLCDAETCSCPPCICTRCTKARKQAASRAQHRRGLERAIADPLALFNPRHL